MVLVFGKYYNVSAKDHEPMRRAGIGSISYDLSSNTASQSRCHHEEQAQTPTVH